MNEFDRPGVRELKEAEWTVHDSGTEHSDMEPSESDEEARLNASKIPLEDISEAEKRNREHDIEVALLALERYGFIQRTNDGEVICDIDKLKRPLNYVNLSQDLGNISRAPHTSTVTFRTAISTFTDIFRDMKVYSKDDHDRFKEGEEVEPKKLFYSPQTIDDALDPERIAQHDFYMLPWEMYTHYYPDTHPHLPEGSEVGFHEATVACIIFHPQYGAAERDDKGKLQVRHPNGDVRPISHQFFIDWGYSGPKSLARARPAQFALEVTPHLVERGLISPRKDFLILEESITGESFGTNFREPTEKGMVTVGGIRFTLGSKFAGSEGYRAFKLSDAYGAVVRVNEDDKFNVERVFDIAGPDVEAAIAKNGTSSRPRVGKKQLVDFLYDIDELRNFDASAAFLAENFDILTEFSRKTAVEAGFGLSSLTAKEQSFAVSMYERFKDDERFWDFIKNYKLQGLKALMLIAGSNTPVDTVLDRVDNLGTDLAQPLFAEAARILDVITDYEDTVRAELHSESRKHLDQATELVLKQTEMILQGGFEAAEGNIEGVDIHDVITLLRKFKEKTEDIYSKDNVQHKRYQELLALFEQGGDEPIIKTIALEKLKSSWMDQLAHEGADGSTLSDVYDDLTSFYFQNEELFESASETTGDTEQELAMFEEYDEAEPIRGKLVDLGCGNGRLTEPRARLLQNRAEVIGIDLNPPDSSSEDNLWYIEGGIEDIPLEDDSVDVVTADWSVLNDALQRSQQMAILRELTRTLKVGGRFRFDVPYLEGGEGSWEEAAKKYNEAYPSKKYGTIVADFPASEGKRVQKEFYIYPQSELKALLEAHGFEVEDVKEWRTKAGKPRLTFEARLKHKVSPVLLDQGLTHLRSHQPQLEPEHV